MDSSGKEIRILLIHNRYRVRGGEDEAVDRESALLTSAGFRVELLEHRSADVQGLKAKLETARDLPYSVAARDEVAAKLASFRPQLVHVHNFFPTFTPSLYDACVAAKIPVVQTLHNFRIFCANGLLARNGKPCELCLKGSALHALRFACYHGSRPGTFALTRMIRKHRRANTWNTKVSAFIALSKFSAHKLAEGGLDPSKIHVKPNFAPAPTLDTMRVPENYALYVGRLSEEKGLRTLVQAWGKLRVPLWIVGDGPLRAEVETLKARNPAVRVLGAMPADSVACIMGKAKFLVVPSECYENFPLVLAEAFAYGLPVIASRLGSLTELVQHERNGLHFEAGNAENLADVVGLLAKSEGLYSRLSETARSTYLEKYTPEINLQRLLEIYRGVLKPTAG